jgi:hypothetical protein
MGLDGAFLGMEYTSKLAVRRDCCYIKCPRPGTIHIGVNGNRETHWICFHHLNKRNADRARFLADGGGCEMRELDRQGSRHEQTGYLWVDQRGVGRG